MPAQTMLRMSSGGVAGFQMDDPDHYEKIEYFQVQPRVHTLAIDPTTHRVYTPEQEKDGKPVARMIVYEAVAQARRGPRTLQENGGAMKAERAASRPASTSPGRFEGHTHPFGWRHTW